MFQRIHELQTAIQVHVNHSIQFINDYENSSQTILNDFFNVFHVLTDIDAFNQALKDFEGKYRGNTELGYFEIPFLWFCVDFSEILWKLSLFLFDMLAFARKFLRKITPLIASSTSLYRQQPWEDLQYELCEEIISLLPNHYQNELEIFYRLGRMVEVFELGALNPSQIRNTLIRSLKPQSGGISREDRVRTFFDLTGMEWGIYFYPPAFLLSWIFIWLEIKDSKLFSEKFDLLDIKNQSIASTGVLYSCTTDRKDFIFGRMAIPKGTREELINHLQYGEKKNILTIRECREIDEYFPSISYRFYDSGTGWNYSIPGLRRAILTRDLDIDSPYKRSFSISNWNKNWLCTWEKEPLRYIELLCNYWGLLNFQPLCERAGEVYLSQDQTELFGSDNRILWEVFEQKVMQILCLPKSLRNFYFIDRYFIVPNIDTDEKLLAKVLQNLPYAISFTFKDKTQRIFTQLNPILVKFLQKELGWKIFNLIQLNRPERPSLKFFDKDLFEFKKPAFLS